MVRRPRTRVQRVAVNALSPGDDWRDPPDGFSCRDIGAVQMLRVTVAAPAALRLTGCLNDDVHRRLAGLQSQIDAEVTPDSDEGQRLLMVS